MQKKAVILTTGKTQFLFAWQIRGGGGEQTKRENRECDRPSTLLTRIRLAISNVYPMPRGIKRHAQVDSISICDLLSVTFWFFRINVGQF